MKPWNWLMASVMLLPVSAAHAQDEDPVLFNRKLTVWAEIVGNGKKQSEAATGLGISLGLPGGPVAVRSQIKLRQAGLMVMDYAGVGRNSHCLPAAIIALREDPEENIRVGAANLLGQWASKLRDDKTIVFRFAEGRDALASSLRTDPAGPVRQAAAAAMGQLTSEDAKGAVTILTTALKDAYPPTRLAACNALRGLGKDAAAAVPGLTEALKDKDNTALLRMQSALALGLIGSPDAAPALPVLREAMTDAKSPLEVRKAVAEALGRLGRDAVDATPQLGAALAASEPLELRRAAVTALDRLGPFAAGAAPQLIKSMKDEDRFVRCVAMHTLGQIGNGLADKATDVVKALLEALNDTSLEVRVASLETLGALGKDVAGDQADTVEKKLIETSRDVRDAVRDAATNALKKFRGM